MCVCVCSNPLEQSCAVAGDDARPDSPEQSIRGKWCAPVVYIRRSRGDSRAVNRARRTWLLATLWRSTHVRRSYKVTAVFGTAGCCARTYRLPRRQLSSLAHAVVHPHSLYLPSGLRSAPQYRIRAVSLYGAPCLTFDEASTHASSKFLREQAYSRGNNRGRTQLARRGEIEAFLITPRRSCMVPLRVRVCASHVKRRCRREKERERERENKDGDGSRIIL